MTDVRFRPAEELKFQILASGISIDRRALTHIEATNGNRVLTPADYASTSGVILRLDGDVWVNAPIATYNPNFVNSPPFTLTMGTNGLLLVGGKRAVDAEFWLPPEYHGRSNTQGKPHAIYAFTHGDRVRIAPITGCAFTCKFCNLPYDFRYRRKDRRGTRRGGRSCEDGSRAAAHTLLISGGTPRPEHYGFLHEVYEAVIESFPRLPDRHHDGTDPRGNRR